MDDQEANTTARLSLRRFRADDAIAFHEIFKDAEAMRYWSTPPHRDIEETRLWISRTIEAGGQGRSDEFVVERDGHVIGKAGLWQGNELGFIFAREAWGLGLASEAIRAVIAHAFARGTTSIVADVDPRNSRAIQLLKRLGFKQTGAAKATLLVGSEWVDSDYFELKWR